MNRKELFAQLKANEKKLIQEKTSSIKYADSCVANAEIIQRIPPKETSTKAAGDSTETSEDSDSILVKVVANTANWMDSHKDVLTADSYSASIFKRGTTIPHILDHKHSVTSFVGDVQKVYTTQLNLKDLGLSQEGSTTALVFETNIRKDYNPEVYKFYKAGKINQHSIGLRYQELRLALDSSAPEDVAYKEVWDKYYPDIINKEEVDNLGYFWAVTKVDVLENSAVLFGANELTPTLELSNNELSTKDETSETIEKDLPTQTALPEQGDNTMTLDEALKKISDLETELKQASALATKAERERTLAIVEAAKTFGLPNENVVKAVTKGWDAETTADIFTEIKSGIDAAKSIDTSAMAFGKTSEEATGSANKTSSGLYIPKFTTEGAK
jgi:hypothetical protein